MKKGSKNIKLVSRAPFKLRYESGERLNLDGMRVLLVSDETTVDITKIIRDRKLTKPKEGDVLKISSVDVGEETIPLVVSYRLRQDFGTIDLSASIDLTVVNELKSLEIVENTLAKHIDGVEIPVVKLNATFSGDKKKEIENWRECFNARYLSAGTNHLVATYTAFGKTKTASLDVNASPIEMVGVEVKYEPQSVFANEHYDKSKISVEWKNNLYGVPNVNPEYETSGTYIWDSGKLSVDKDYAENFNDRKVTVCIREYPTLTDSFDLGWNKMLSGIAIGNNIPGIVFWDGARKWDDFNSQIPKFVSVYYDDGSTSILDGSFGISIKSSLDPKTLVTVPTGQVSVEVPLSIDVSKTYDVGTATASAVVGLSSYRKLSSLAIFGFDFTFYEGEVFNPVGIGFRARYSNNDYVDLTLDDITETNISPGTTITTQDTYNASYEEPSPNPKLPEMSIKVSDKKFITIVPDLISEAKLTYPSWESPISDIFIGDYVIEKWGETLSNCPVILSVKLENTQRIVPELHVSSLTSGIDSFKIQPTRITSLSDYEIELEWKRTVVGVGETNFIFSVPLDTDYISSSENQLSICSLPRTEYFEDELFDPTNLSVNLVFSNGFTIDVTDDILFSLSCEEHVMSYYDTAIPIKYTLQRKGGVTEDFTCEVPVNVIPKLIYEIETDSSSPVAQVRFNTAWKNSGLPMDDIFISDYVIFGGIEYATARIAPSGFYECSDIISIRFPSSIVEIGEAAFYGCSSLYFSDGELDIRNITNIGASAFMGCSKIENVLFPVNSNFNTVPNSMLANTGITNIVIPENITSIGEYAFSNCKSLGLTSGVVLLENINSLGVGAFASCDFELVDMADSNIATIGKECFKDCHSLSNIIFSGNTTSIDDLAFSNCNSITGITIPQQINSIGASAFMGCGNLLTFFMAGNMAHVGENAFNFHGDGTHDENLLILFLSMGRNSIDEIYKKNGDIDINEKYKYWTGFIEPTNETYVADMEYAYNLQYNFEIIDHDKNKVKIASANRDFLNSTIIIPLSVNLNGEKYDVVEIGDGVFTDIDFITEVKVAPSISSIGNDSFAGCTKLSTFAVNSFNDYTPDINIRASSVEPEGDEGSATKKSNEVPVLGIVRIGTSAFANTALSSLDAPYLGVVGKEAFLNTSMTSASIIDVEPPTGIALSDWNPFKGCHMENLSVGCWQLPISVTFDNIDSITDIYVKGVDQYKSVCDYGFAGCLGLSSFSIEDVHGFGSRIFNGCSLLKNIPELPIDMQLKPDTFAGVELTACVVDDENGNVVFHIPSSVVSEDGSYSLEDNMLSIMSYAISGVENLKCLTIPKLFITNDDGDVVEFPRFISQNAITDTGMLSLEIGAGDFGKLSDGNYPEKIFSNNRSLSSFSSKLGIVATPYMLDGCQALEDVSVDDDGTTISSIGTHAFSNTGLKTISINISSVNNLSIESEAFEGTSLTAFHSNKKITTNGEKVFDSENNLELVEVPIGEEKLGDVFGTNVISAIIDFGNTLIMAGEVNSLFNVRALSLIDCTSLDTSDEGGALEGLSSLSSVKFIGNCPATLGTNSFYGDVNLESLILSSVLHVGDCCFGNCTRLSSIVFYGSIPTFDDKTNDNDTTVFDTGGESLSILLGNNTYLKNWNDGISSKISKSLSNSVIPTTWHRENVKPNDIEIRIRDMYPQELKGSFLVFDYPIDKISIDYEDKSKPKITVYDRINPNDFRLNIELPEPDWGTENPGIGTVELKNSSTYGNIVMFEDVEDDEEEN